MLENTLDRPGRIDVALNRFPLKHLWDSAALGRLIASPTLSAGQKAACLRFYFSAGDIFNLYPTLTRSGSNWSLLGIALARDLARGGDGEFFVKDEFWHPAKGIVYTKLDWREPAGTWEHPTDDPVIFHTHHPYFRLRSARLKRMKIVVLLRDIYDSMESKYYKHIGMIRQGITPAEKPNPKGGTITAPPSEDNQYHFPWDKMINDAIEFFNSWGDAMRWHPNIRLVRYEELLADPAEAHKEMTDFWGMNLPMECLQEAFRRTTKEEMKKRLPEGRKEFNTRVAFRSQGATMPAERVAHIRYWLERRLVHDFGYGIEWPGSATQGPRDAGPAPTGGP